MMWLPRLRGDGPYARQTVDLGIEAPPPTRGWTQKGRHVSRHGVGSPAYAGMDPWIGITFGKARWLPRLRGDGPVSHICRITGLRAPPPTRGWTLEGVLPHVVGDGSPAYAGMDLKEGESRRAKGRLPRLRGDGPLCSSSVMGFMGAPPPTRGWTSAEQVFYQHPLGSPAYAGMDRCMAGGTGRSRGLPRLRGDGPS